MIARVSFWFFIVSSILYSSCSNKFSIQKRRYNHGLYFSSNHKTNSTTKTIAHNNKVTDTIKFIEQIISDESQLIAGDFFLSKPNLVEIKTSSNNEIGILSKIKGKNSIHNSLKKMKFENKSDIIFNQNSKLKIRKSKDWFLVALVGVILIMIISTIKWIFDEKEKIKEKIMAFLTLLVGMVLVVYFITNSTAVISLEIILSYILLFFGAFWVGMLGYFGRGNWFFFNNS